MIFCVDDDSAIRDIEVYTLTATGFEAVGFADANSMLEALHTQHPQLILLDIMLPDADGVTVLQKLRADSATQNIPVIMATAKGTEYDKVQSLDLGADDYLVKPFGVMEMVSRVKAVLRRAEKPQADTLAVSGLVLDLRTRTVTADAVPIRLTYKEFELLSLLMQNPGMAFSREQLLSRVWGMDFYGETRTVDMHIKTLRKKLGTYGGLIKTVIHIGYKLEAGE